MARPSLPRPVHQVAASIAAIHQTATRAAAITRALRTLSRDARQDDAGPVAAAAILDDAGSLLTSRFASGGVPLRITRPTPSPTMRGRPAAALTTFRLGFPVHHGR